MQSAADKTKGLVLVINNAVDEICTISIANPSVDNFVKRVYSNIQAIYYI